MLLPELGYAERIDAIVGPLGRLAIGERFKSLKTLDVYKANVLLDIEPSLVHFIQARGKNNWIEKALDVVLLAIRIAENNGESEKRPHIAELHIIRTKLEVAIIGGLPGDYLVTLIDALGGV